MILQCTWIVLEWLYVFITKRFFCKTHNTLSYENLRYRMMRTGPPVQWCWGLKGKSSRALSSLTNQGLFSSADVWLGCSNSKRSFKSITGCGLQRSIVSKSLVRQNGIPLHMAHLALTNVTPYKESTTGPPCVEILWASLKVKSHGALL